MMAGVRSVYLRNKCSQTCGGLFVVARESAVLCVRVVTKLLSDKVRDVFVENTRYRYMVKMI